MLIKDSTFKCLERKVRRETDLYFYFRRVEGGFLEKRIHSFLFRRVRETDS